MKVLIALVCLLQTATALGNPDAVVKLHSANGQCSGVFVSPFGHILSAEHCGSNNVEAEIDGVRVPCEILHEPERNGRDECRLLRTKVTPANVRYIPIASRPPQTGDAVSGMGFARGRFTRLTGNVTESTGPLVVCDFRSIEGQSGGPLLNAEGYVVGIASSRSMKKGERYRDQRGRLRTWRQDTPAYSRWIGLSEINATLTAANVPRELTHTQLTKTRLWVFSMPRCKPCVRWKRDHDAGHFSMYDVTIFDVSTPAGAAKWAALRKALQQTTGRTVPNLIPAFYIPGRRSVVTGYPKGTRQWQKLARDLIGTLRLPVTILQSLAGLFADDDEAAAPGPDAKSPTTPEEGSAASPPPPATAPVPPQPTPPADQQREKPPTAEPGHDDTGNGIFWELALAIGGLVAGAFERRLAA